MVSIAADVEGFGRLRSMEGELDGILDGSLEVIMDGSLEWRL